MEAPLVQDGSLGTKAESQHLGCWARSPVRGVSAAADDSSLAIPAGLYLAGAPELEPTAFESARVLNACTGDVFSFSRSFQNPPRDEVLV